MKVLINRIWTFAVMACLVVGCRSEPGGGRAGERKSPTRDAVGSVRDALVQTEKEWGRALVETNVSALGRCLADEWLLTYSDGSIVTKPMALVDLGSGALRIESIRIDDVTLLDYNDT